MRRVFSRSSLTLAFTLLVTALPAAAQYKCDVNLAANTSSCTGGPITAVSGGNTDDQRTFRVNTSGYARLDALIEVCNPTGWWIHFGDSPGNDGGGGDGGQTYHDAETYFTGTTFYTIGTYNYSQGALDPIVTVPNLVASNICRTVHYTLQESRVDFDDDGNAADTALQTVQSLSLHEVSPYNESDGEDPYGNDANYWYAGINRTYADAYRNGTGVTRVCFVLSTTANPSSSSITCPSESSNQPPNACFTYFPFNPTRYDYVYFDASCSSDSDGSIVNYSWNFGDGSTGTGAYPAHSYSQDGLYQVTLTVTDDDGSTDVYQEYIYVCTPGSHGFECPI